MLKPYRKLRFELQERDYDLRALAVKLNRSVTYVSRHLTGQQDWALREVYAIMDLIEAPLDQIGEYFPPSDVPQKKKERRKIG